jgi:filamentous hemagglutinin family protein
MRTRTHRGARSGAAPRRRPTRRPRLSALLRRLLAALALASGSWLSLAQAQVPQAAPLPTLALPSGGQIVVGGGQISSSAGQMLIQQTTQRLGIDWQSFNIGSGARVEFRQPGADAVALNRVLGNDASRIFGQLSSNGQVFLVNPNGVLFAPGAQVDVGGLVASTLDLSQPDFAAGQYRFAGASSGAVANQGRIGASAGGYVALFGRHVENAGEVTVPGGQVLLASGRAATVSISAGGLLSAVVTPNDEPGTVNNRGLLAADGGNVTLNAHSAQSIAASLVNNSGIVRANSIVERGGEIWITGDNVASGGTLSATGSGSANGGRILLVADLKQGQAAVSGTLDASAAGSGDGGFIETSGAKVRVAPEATLTTASAQGRTGTWLIDPNDYNIGGPNSDESGAALGGRLANNNVTIVSTQGAGGTAGDINVFDAVTWSASTTLTLNATRHVNVNADITAGGASAGIALNPGTGGSFNLATGSRIRLPGAQSSVTIGGVPHVAVRTLAELQAINASNTARSGSYVLVDTLDAGGSATLNGGLGFVPIGASGNYFANDSFRGRLDGLGNAITGLTVDRPAAAAVGLFGAVHDARIANLVLDGGAFTGQQWVGALAGFAGASGTANAPALTITNVRSNAAVTRSGNTGTAYAGGLVGQLAAGTGVLGRSHGSGAVTASGSGSAGGLVGNVSAGTIAGSSAGGDVLGTDYAGGLVGQFGGSGSISDASTTGTVGGRVYVGGLVGHYTASGTISGSLASGNVSAVGANTTTYLGGLVGYLAGANIGSSSAQGNLSATAGSSNQLTGYFGGLVGYYASAPAGGGITGSSASGSIGSDFAYGDWGGLVGYMGAGSVTGVVNNGVVAPTASGSVTASNTSFNNRDLGGLIGQFTGNGGLTDVRATGAVSGAYRGGGLLGSTTANGNITNALASGNVGATSAAGGLIGYGSSAGAVSGSQAGGTVTTGSSGGGLIGEWSFSGGISDSRATGAVTGVPTSGALGGLVGYAYQNGTFNNNSASGNISGGTYTGGLVGQLYYTTLTRGSASGSVASTGNGSVYIGGLVGLWQGNTGSLVSDVSATGNVFADAVSVIAGGLFGQFNEGGLANATATGSVTARDSANPSSSSHYAGGLVGYFSSGSGGIVDSSASGRVTGDYYTGGLAGYLYAVNTTTPSLGTLNNLSATGDVTGTVFTGGLIGYGRASGGLANANATGNVTGQTYAGGLVGELDYTNVDRATASGNVTAQGSGAFAGGLIAYAAAASGTVASMSISNSRASGAVIGASYVGGLVGRFDDSSSAAGAPAAISASSASGNVSGTTAAGGLVGAYYQSNSAATTRGIRSSFATGNVITVIVGGGLVGEFESHAGIQDSYATGNVTGTGASSSDRRLGGLVGEFQNYSNTGATTAQIVRSMASGNVALDAGVTLSTFTDVYGGGLIGYSAGGSATGVSVADSYANGSVSLTNTSGRMVAGGLLGYATSGVARSYATGAVSATGVTSARRTGGLVAQTANTSVAATASFWATDTSGQSTSVIGTASTLAALRSAATFAGWDLATSGGSSSAWRLYEGLATPLVRSILTPLTVTLGDVSKVYDGTTSLGSVPLTFGSTPVAFPNRILVGGGAPADAGTYSGALGAANLYSVQNGYDLSVAGSGTLTITPRPLTLAGAVANKVYDGTTAATLTGAQLGGLVAGEDLSVALAPGATLSFADKNVGNGKTVTLNGAFSIADGVRGKASNYQAPALGTATADIAPATLTGATFNATNRVYDGSTTVAVTATGGSLSGVIAGDSVSVNLGAVTSGTVTDKNAGTAKPVTVQGAALAGPDAGNYVLGGANALTVDIAPRPLTVNGIVTGSNGSKVYNAGTSVSLNLNSTTLGGLVAGDDVLVRNSNVSGSTADKNVGNARAVTVTGLALRGADAANYTPVPGAVSVNVTPYPLTVYLSFRNASSRVYDGTTNADVYWPVYWYGNDDITVNATSIGFADKNVAYTQGGQVTSKTVTASGLSLSGADAANYTLQNTTSTTTGTITPKPLTVSGVTAANRVYDGTRDVQVTISGATVNTGDVIAGDQVAVSTPGTGTVTGQMADKNVGNSKPVTVPNLTLTGTDAGNYTLSGAGSGVVVDITRRPVTATYTAQDKSYDGDVYATMSVTSPDLVAGDAIGFYIDQNVCGVNACGYAQFAVPGSVNGQSFTATRNAGSDLPVVVTFNQMWGNDAGNYQLLNPTGSSSATITPKTVTPQFTGGSKDYDGTNTAPVSLVFNNQAGQTGLYTVDRNLLTFTADAVFLAGGTNPNLRAKDTGTGKPVQVSNVVLGGAAAGNYVIANTYTGAQTTGTVTAKPVTVSGISATDRPYDGTTTVQVSAGGAVTSTGFVTGDDVSIMLPQGGLSTGTIANRNVGTAKPVTVTGLGLAGTDAFNYSIDATASGITVNITPAQLTPTFAGGTRVYDGGVTASVTSTTSGVLAGDTVTVSGSGVFTGPNAKDVGSGKPIAVSNITLGGAQAANYSLATTTADTTGTITPKPVTPQFAGGSRVYNGLADRSAPVVGTSLQFVVGDQVGFTQTALFDGDGAAGTNKPVTITGIALAGPQATNYSLLGGGGAVATATITPRPLGVTGITATGRVYDGTTSVAIDTSNARIDTSGVIAGDQVSAVLPPGGISTGTLLDRFAGSNKEVRVTGITLSGAQAANYAAVGATGLFVTITPRPLTASYSALDKVYDGTATATIGGSSADLLTVDSGSLGFSASGVFAGGRNVGSALQVNVSNAFLTGAARDSYLLLNPNGSATASITPRTANVSFAGLSKVYDGTATAQVRGTVGNLVAGDVVDTTQSAVFTGSNAKNVGSNKPIAVSGVALAGNDAGNYVLGTFNTSASGTITPKPITVSGLSNLVAQDRVYDGTRTVQVAVPGGVTLTPNSSDIIAGDAVTINVPASGNTTGTMVDKHVGNGKTVTVDGLTLSGADAPNYLIQGTAGILVNITPRSLTASFAGVNKVYDGTAAATVSGTSADVIAGDSLVIQGNGLFSSGKNVGTGKAISVASAALSGSDARNYLLLNTTGSASADITPRPLTPAFTGGSKVYDGGLDAPVTSSTAGIVAGDGVQIQGTARFADKNAGSGKPVSVTGITLAGGDAANYSLTAGTAAATASITPKPITLTGLTGVSAVNRAYDGTRTVQINVISTGTVGIDPADIIAGDQVSVAQLVGNLTSGSMADKNAGLGKAVSVDGLALTGTDARNYSVAATSGVTVDIAPRPLTAVYSAASRAYDGTTTATVGGSSADLIAGDVLTIGGTGQFSGSGAKNVGSGKTVVVTGGTLGGTDAANYALVNTSGTATASITPRNVSVAYTGLTRVYDGTTAAPVEGNAAGLIAGDAVSLTQNAEFTGPGAKNAGTNKPITISGIALAGADAANYSLTATSASASGTITPRPVTITGLTGISALDRVYDGTLDVQVNVSTAGTPSVNPGDIVAGDDLTVSIPGGGIGAGRLLTKDAGSNKPVIFSGLSLSGADAANYSIGATSGLTVNIARRPLTASYAGASKVYDGSAAIAVNGSSGDIVAGDLLTIAGNGQFTGAGAKNVGTGKTIQITGATLGGADAGNYSLLNPDASTTGSITPRALDLTWAGVDREYDGTAVALVRSTTSNLVAGDDVSIAQLAQFTGPGAKNVGSGKAVQISGITLGGADAANYSLAGTTATTSAGITPKRLTISGISGITATDRVYDGTLDVAVTIGAVGQLTGDVIAGDDVIITAGAGVGSGGRLLDKHAGNNKAVAINGLVLSGADKDNYEVGAAQGVTVNIAPKVVQITGVSAVDRAYDGTRTVALDTAGSAIDGAISGDDVRVATSGVTGEMADRHVGRGKAVAPAALALLGDDARNYTVTGGSGLTVNVTPRLLNPVFTGVGRVYDGGVDVAVSGSAAGIVAGDQVTIAGNGLFVGPGAANAGSNKPIDVRNVNLAGSDAGNYALPGSTGSGIGSIAPRPVTVASPSIVRFADEPTPTDLSVQVSGLIGGDRLTASVQVPAASEGAPGVSYFELAPSGAVFVQGEAANYSLRYLNGLLVVLPKPPRTDEANAGSGQGANTGLAVAVDAEDLERALDELGRTAAQDPNITRRARSNGDGLTLIERAMRPLPRDEAEAIAAAITVETTGGGPKIALPRLLRMPLISFDDKLRRLVFGDAVPAR